MISYLLISQASILVLLSHRSVKFCSVSFINTWRCFYNNPVLYILYTSDAKLIFIINSTFRVMLTRIFFPTR